MAFIRIKDIHDPGQAVLATRAVAQTLDRLGKRVFTNQDLLRLIGKHREDWHILDRVKPKKIIDYLLTTNPTPQDCSRWACPLTEIQSISLERSQPSRSGRFHPRSSLLPLPFKRPFHARPRR